MTLLCFSLDAPYGPPSRRLAKHLTANPDLVFNVKNVLTISLKSDELLFLGRSDNNGSFL